ncbi:helix-turn-helix transcriptional regulator [Hymenobacter sp. YC55]|uniref:helix-turn-helix domain-containing protein n=1 Tax=Hymenobacter sp. YC55 TaxID=3034019 RepID=UPI0023F81620|nr:helix-turn-helix transcriptional regulator [Hymenobacter sp. YC55]MDF7810742.1 helix-turn-helix transcriptional regulator [Hymenobacter sp. YC55]
MALPDFSITAMDLRFLAELDRLQQAGSFATYRELAEQLDVHPNTFGQIEIGRYHCNIKQLYQLRSFHPEADVLWVLFGEAETGRPEPTGAPKRGERGRPVRVH